MSFGMGKGVSSDSSIAGVSQTEERKTWGVGKSSAKRLAVFKGTKTIFTTRNVPKKEPSSAVAR